MQDDNHGHSQAAWIGVAIMLVGAVIACWGIFWGPFLLLFVGLGVAVVGALAWYTLDRAGMGGESKVVQEES